jgi:hypothetical protein
VWERRRLICRSRRTARHRVEFVLVEQRAERKQVNQSKTEHQTRELGDAMSEMMKAPVAIDDVRREKYQVMPALLTEDYEALKADIAARGVIGLARLAEQPPTRMIRSRNRGHSVDGLGAATRVPRRPTSRPNPAVATVQR